MSNSISPISYTNKDFRSIYEEILNLAKDLSYKWDPTISNESDPGVVLLKLNAIIGDKNNYNIDKNILEAFPETVTQETAARQLFAQLGYKMPWYRAATTNVSLKWIGRDLNIGEIITIPKFTMITNDEGDTVYTLIEESQINRTTKNSTTTVKAIQGTVVEYSIAGNKTISSSNFDKLNRIYLNDYNVAENGIFISNVTDKSVEWTLVDNINLYPTGSYVFEFNVDPRTNYCYLEFPEDFDVLIGSGINITYIVTKGSQGNVKSKNLTNFFNDISIKLSGEEIVLNTETMELYNNSAAINGDDPEDIDGAYRSYKRVVGTFDTLVTLRDYLNAAYTSGLVSNGVVSDRMNDIQTTYSIITTNVESLNSELIQEKIDDDGHFQFVKVWPANRIPKYEEDTYYIKDENNPNLLVPYNTPWGGEQPNREPLTNNNLYILKSKDTTDLTAYDLRMYMLKNVGQINDLTDYNKSFENIPSSDETMSELYGYLENLQCVQHNFKDILKNRYCMFKSVYPLNIKIVPQYKLTDTQINTLKNNVFDALRKLLCSSNVDFGTEPDYDVIYNTIENADNRIKFIMLDDFQFITYAVYWDEWIDNNGNLKSGFKEIPISEFTADNTIFGDNDKLTKELSDSKNKNCYFINSEEYTTEDNVTHNPFTCFVVENNKLKLYSDKIQEFRAEILAKSVLAGITSLFNVDNRFLYTIDKQITEPTIENVYKITTKLTLSPFGGTVQDPSPDLGNEVDNPIGVVIEPYAGTETIETQYTLKDNESLRFYGPSFKTDTSYSNYVKFMVILADATGFEYSIVDLGTEEPISIHNPVYLYQYDSLKDKFEYKEYTTNAYVEDPYGNEGTITKLSADGTLQVFRRVSAYTIPPNVDYKLNKGDYIVFFWREEQEDDSPYTYKKYSGIDESLKQRGPNGELLKSPVISASFTIVASDAANAKVPLSQLPLETGTIPHSNAINSAYYKISELYGDYDLSGSKTIDIKDINQVELGTSNDKPYYYFVTNDVRENSKGEESYFMTFLYDGDEDKATHLMYILDEDEYFIQVNSAKSAYEIYGPGTMIRTPILNGVGEELDVVAIDYNDIINNGISAIEKVVKELNGSLVIREQQMYTLTSGDTVYITLDDNYFDSTPRDVDITVSEVVSGLPKHMLEPTAAQSTIDVTKNLQGSQETTSQYSIGTVTTVGDDTTTDVNYVLPSCIVKNYELVKGDDIIVNSDDDNSFTYCNLISINKYNVFDKNKLGIYGLNLVYRQDTNSLTPKFKLAKKDNISATEKYYLIENYNETTHKDSNEAFLYKYDSATDTYVVCDRNEAQFVIVWFDVNNREPQDGDYLNYEYYEFSDFTYYKPVTTTTNINGMQVCNGYNLLRSIPEADKGKILGVVTITNSVIPKVTNKDNYSYVYKISGCVDSYGDDITYHISYDNKEETEYPIFTSDDYTNVSNMTITFSTDGTSIQSLPVSKVGDNDGSWKGTARLDIQSSSSTPQPIAPIDEYSGQVYYVAVKQEDGTYMYKPFYVFLEETVEEVDNNQYILSNVEVAKVGGNDVDVSYVDLLGNRHGIDLQVYNKNSAVINNDAYTSDISGNLHIKMLKNDYVINGITCESGYFYILPVQSNSLKGTFELTLESAYESDDIPYTLHDFDVEYGNGTYYFILPITESGTPLSIKLSILTEDKDAVITLMPFVKYKEEVLFEDKYNISVTDIINKMKHFDKENKFRYNYIVPEDKLISDPLMGKTFFNSNHICNKFTIPKANLDTTRTTDGIKPLPNNSEIIIVSNR